MGFRRNPTHSWKCNFTTSANMSSMVDIRMNISSVTVLGWAWMIKLLGRFFNAINVHFWKQLIHLVTSCPTWNPTKHKGGKTEVVLVILVGSHHCRLWWVNEQPGHEQLSHPCSPISLVPLLMGQVQHPGQLLQLATIQATDHISLK